MHRQFYFSYQAAVAILGVLLACLSQTAHSEPMGVRPKKLIETGWDKPTPEMLRQNLAEMEKRPFDGVVINVTGKAADGQFVQLDNAFQNQSWNRAGFQKAVDDLKACHFKKFTDNFIIVSANPGDVDWFDDAGWKNIVEHFRIAAWVAREGGMKGICFDAEAYRSPIAQFDYAAQAGHDKHSFDEYFVKARQRGREVMNAIASEDPDLVLFTYRLNSANVASMGQYDSRSALAAAAYGLYAPFVDGWLDVVPPSIKIVDGFEDSYTFNNEVDFLRAAATIRSDALDFVSPENRTKYRAQVETGFGLYMEAYSNAPTSTYYVDPKGTTPADRLGINTAMALHLSDRYVWLNGEQYRWWPTTNSSVKPQSWSEILPGVEDALGYASNPREMARTKLASMRAAGTLQNLIHNADFSAGPPDVALSKVNAPADWKSQEAPAQWNTWQVADSKGTLGWDISAGERGAAKATQVKQGCFIQAANVKPGERYAVGAKYRQNGHGAFWIRVRWQTAEGKWINNDAIDTLVFDSGTPEESQAKPEDWHRLFGVARVPEGAGKIVVLLMAGNQTLPSDVAWFDDIQLYQLPATP